MARKMLGQTAFVAVLVLVVAANGAHALAQRPMKCLAQMNTIARQGRGHLPLTRVGIVLGNAEGVGLALLMAVQSSVVLVLTVVPFAAKASVHNSSTKPSSHRSLTLLGNAGGAPFWKSAVRAAKRIFSRPKSHFLTGGTPGIT